MFLLPVMLFLFGTMMGSFGSVLIHRIYVGERGILWGRSHCPACQKTLGFQHLIPIVSFLVQGGKCAHCNAAISYSYPLLEVIMGLLFMAVGFQYGVEGLSWPLLYMLVVMFVFVVMSVYDLKYMEIPDEVSLPAIGAALLVSVFWGFPVHIVDGLLGAGGILLFFGLQIVVSRGRWIGLGDLRIGALMGLILGWQLSLVALFFSYVLGSVIAGVVAFAQRKSLRTEVPFGPFLTLGFLVALFWGRAILEWYLGFLVI